MQKDLVFAAVQITLVTKFEVKDSNLIFSDAIQLNVIT